MLPSTALRLRWRGAAMVAAWLACELHWLYWAYYLEFMGQNTFLQVWVASLAFFGANVGVIAALVSAHRVAPLFRDGELQGFSSAAARARGGGGSAAVPASEASRGGERDGRGAGGGAAPRGARRRSGKL